MARPDKKALISAAKNYLKEHPEEIVRALKGALGLKIGVPLDALRYLAKELTGGEKAPKDIEIDSAPPGVRIAMTVEAVGSVLRVSLCLFVEEIEITSDQIRVTTRIADLALKVLEGFQTPVSALVQSGALDLSKPGNLVAFIPKRPPMIVDAKDDRIVIDALKVPKLADNTKVRRALAIATPVLNIRAIRSKDDHLDVHLKATLSGLPDAVAAARS
ncbi:MAG: hypothetical protein IPG04_06125 [Polyangiaceae bacterium]|jgi:hypothetical protein|nr:hypothetical protein [Polyangiaceae bacterium]